MEPQVELGLRQGQEGPGVLTVQTHRRILTLPPGPARESQAIARADFDLRSFMASSNRLALWQIAETLSAQV